MKYWALYSVSVFLVSIALFRSAKNMPTVDVSSGQVLYSVDVATSQVVATGYRIPGVGYVAAADYRNVARPTEKAAGTQETSLGKVEVMPVLGRSSAPNKPVPANSRTTVEQRRPEKISPSDELLNPYIIENLIKSSDKTYYFTEKSLTRTGVTVELLSMTPRKDDYFLKFRITNASKDYFIPQAFAVRHGDDWVDLDKFFKHILQDGESQVGYLRVKASASVGAGKDKMFQLNESGKGFRKYSIFY